MMSFDDFFVVLFMFFFITSPCNAVSSRQHPLTANERPSAELAAFPV